MQILCYKIWSIDKRVSVFSVIILNLCLIAPSRIAWIVPVSIVAKWCFMASVWRKQMMLPESR